MKDAQGNKIMEGQTVHVRIGNEWIYADVQEVNEGGIVAIGGQHAMRDDKGRNVAKVTPGHIKLVAQHEFIVPNTEMCLNELVVVHTVKETEEAAKAKGHSC